MTAPSDDDDLDLVDAHDIAVMLEVHVVTARKLQREGSIASAKIGQRRLSRRADVARYVRDRIEHAPY